MQTIVKDREIFVRKGTWFSNFHISSKKGLALCSLLAADETFNTALKELKYFRLGTSKFTVCSFNKIKCSIQQHENGLLGGPDVFLTTKIISLFIFYFK